MTTEMSNTPSTWLRFSSQPLPQQHYTSWEPPNASKSRLIREKVSHLYSHQ